MCIEVKIQKQIIDKNINNDICLCRDKKKIDRDKQKARYIYSESRQIENN